MSNQVGDCFKFCGLLRKPELYVKKTKMFVILYSNQMFLSNLTDLNIIFSSLLSSSFWSTYDARKLHSKSFLYKFVAFWTPQSLKKTKVTWSFMREIHVNIPNQFLISHFSPLGTESGNLDINFLLKRPSDFCFLDTLGGTKCNVNVKEDLGVKFSCIMAEYHIL